MISIRALQLTLTYAAGTALFSYLLAVATTRIVHRASAVDHPTGGRKIHNRSVPLWGGLGIALSIVCFSFVLLFLNASDIFSFSLDGARVHQLIGFATGVVILLVGGLIDDVRPLGPRTQIIFPIFAALAVIMGGTGIIQVTHPFHRGALSLVWWQGYGLSLPSDLITFVWLLVAIYATKLLDGLDGLVAGLTVIGSGLVASLSLSPAYYQPGVAVFSGILGGAYAGFLPRNFYPARQFLGEAGSTLAGFSLGFLAILSGAKIAIALVVLAIPITDLALVALRRIRRGDSWYAGDDTHLHFRLLRIGLSQPAAVCLFWGISLFAGIVALTMQTKGKLFLISALVLLGALLSYFLGLKTRGKEGSI